jgi:dipeptidase E
MKLFLLSCSFLGDRAYLDYAKDSLTQFLEICPPGHIVFIPYAVSDYDAKTERAREFLSALKPEWGSALIGIHRVDNAKEMLRTRNIKAIFVTGGNTFLLLRKLQELELLGDIKSAVENGAGYIGVSAGANLASPTIMTTNDMPIAEVKGFNALGLVDFQINPHFVQDGSDHLRIERITEYIKENHHSVVGLPDGAMIEVDGDTVKLQGSDATIFNKNDSSSSLWHVGDHR